MYVHTIEPAETFFNRAKKKFENGNVTVHHGTSEEVLPELLPQLSGSMNFWLDGHYSGGETFQGDQECPIIDELDAISLNRARFENIVVLIDDIRCFYSEPSVTGYPNVSYLTNWAELHGLTWHIEHDIMIMGSMTKCISKKIIWDKY